MIRVCFEKKNESKYAAHAYPVARQPLNSVICTVLFADSELFFSSQYVLSIFCSRLIKGVSKAHSPQLINEMYTTNVFI